MKMETFSGSVMSQLPYSIACNENTAVTYNLDLTQTIKLNGVAFETLDVSELNALSHRWLFTLNTALKGGRVAMWTHVIRKKIKFNHDDVVYDNDFSQDFAEAYYKKLGKDNEFVNDIYVSPVYRAAPSRLDKLALRLSKKKKNEISEVYQDNVEEFNKVSEQLMVSLRQFRPTLLGAYDKDGIAFSEQAEFYSHLLNHEETNIPYARKDLSAFIMSKEINFGHEVIELSGNAGSEYAAILSLNVPYEAGQVNARCFEGLLSAPFEYILSQSITTVPFNEADKTLEMQYNNILSTSNNSIELEKLRETRERLQAGEFNFLKHELCLILYGNSIKELNKNINEATAIINQKGFVLSRLKRAVMKRCYFNILPANFLFPRQRAVSIRDDVFCYMSPMHNHPTGNINGSQWGLPIAAMKTMSDTPYFFNYHVSRNRLAEMGLNIDEDTEEKEHRKEVGNYQIVGRTGSGKTVVKVVLRLLAKKVLRNGQRLKTFSFDKDYGEEIAIRAIGGQYFRIQKGVSTNINPFSLPRNLESVSFIHSLIKWCVQHKSNYLMSAKDDDELLKSIKNVYTLPQEQQRLRTIRHYLSKGDENSLYQQLGKWCENGSMAWLLDGEKDRFDLSISHDFGFDMTEVLDDDDSRTPLLTYLTHKISLAANGSPHIVDIAEAWKALKDPFMKEYILNKGKTIRKENGIIGLDTQDPDDISKSDIGASLLSQFPTLILMPNSTARKEDYMNGLKLSLAEYELIRYTPEGMGRFMIKKGNESVMVKMDLSGMNDMLSIVSSSIDNVNVLHEIMSEVGEDPKVWLPIFKQRRN